MFTRLLVTLVWAVLTADALASHSGFPVAIAAGPRPQPVMVNGKKHLVYELHLTNIAPIPIEILSLDIFGDDEPHPWATYRDGGLDKLVVPAENLLTSVDAAQASKVRTIAGGKTVLIFLDVTLGLDARLPAELHHRFSFAIR